MISLLYNLVIGGCFGHKWNVMEKRNKYDTDDSEHPYKAVWILRCVKCGAIKTKSIK